MPENTLQLSLWKHVLNLIIVTKTLSTIFIFKIIIVIIIIIGSIYNIIVPIIIIIIIIIININMVNTMLL